MVPQRVWAEATTINASDPKITVESGLLTITSSAATSLRDYMQTLNSEANYSGDDSGEIAKKAAALTKLSSMKACSKIVLDGKFNSDDLSKIANDQGFNNVTEVDMSEARFSSSVTYESSDWYLYHSAENLPTTANLRTQAIVGGTLYRYEGSRTWTPISYPSGQTITPYVSSEAMESDKESVAVGSYAKYPTGYTYRQLIVLDESWNVLSYAPSGEIITVTWSDIMRNDYVHDFTAGQKIKAKHYYKWVSGAWIECTTSGDLAGLATSDEIIDGAAFKAVEGSLDGRYGHDGSYIWFWHYFEKTETGRSWSEPGSSESFKEGDFDENERDNYKSSYKHGDWVRMRVYSYYRLDIDASNSWKEVAYVDGFHINTTNIKKSKSEVDAISGPNYGDYAVVINNDNQKKVFDGTSWVSFSAGTVLSDFSEMKFDYWKETLTTAITSNYATETISSSIFSGCKKLTTVDYRSGNVTGFSDHNKQNSYLLVSGTDPAEYLDLSVTIGKDVTRIDDNAFKDCDVLKTINFDMNYKDGEGNLISGYPKELTIGNNAFQECYALSGIIIPNRVTSIGNRAFYRAGNVVKNLLEPTEDVNFTVTFERRNGADEGGSSINYDCELTIGTEAFMDCVNLRELSLPIRLKSMGNGAFKNTFGLTSLTMREEGAAYPEDKKLKTIPSEAFLGSHVGRVVVPKSVTLIENQAFGQTNYLSEIVIQSNKDNNVDVAGQPTLTIKSGAFTGGSESDVPVLNVEVDIDPTKRLVICEYNAFTFTQMEGQTAVDNNHRAVLHFNKDYWDYYQGDWKKGLAFQQSNLNAFKDGYTDTDELCMGMYNGDRSNINSTTGKYEYGEVGPEDGQFTPANGWQQFAITNTGIDIVIPDGDYIRTYSTYKPYYIPLFEQGGVKKYFMRIYRVTNFSDGFIEGTDNPDSREDANKHARIAAATEVVNKINNRIYIPANTGLILLGQGSDNQSYLLYQEEVSSDDQTIEKGYKEYQYAENVTLSETSNLLYPSCIASGNNVNNDESKILLYPTIPYPINPSAGIVTQYRVFGFSAAERKFYRSTPGTQMNRDRAYLKLPVSLFHWTDETGGTGQSGTGSDTTNPVSSSRINLIFDGEDNGELTGIETSVVTRCSDDGYYTIQGVKFSRPQGRGLYIYKGRKIFVK